MASAVEVTPPPPTASATEPICARDVAQATRVSESRLKLLFQETLGLSWVKYLQGYRIHRAAALLSESTYNVT